MVSEWAFASVSRAVPAGLGEAWRSVAADRPADRQAASVEPPNPEDLPTEPFAGAAAPTVSRASEPVAAPKPSVRTVPDVPPPQPHAADALGAIAAFSPFAGELLRRLGDRGAPPLAARYDDGSLLWFDFAARAVIVEPKAWVRLRAQRELPGLVTEPVEPTALSAKATTQDLDAVTWACGLAAHALPLLGAPLAWQRASLRPQGRLRLAELSRMPAHLHLCEVLACGSSTPAALRRATRVDVTELRAFLQAALFVQAVRWALPLDASAT